MLSNYFKILTAIRKPIFIGITNIKNNIRKRSKDQISTSGINFIKAESSG